MGQIIFKLNEKLYVRDPQSTLLGQKIVEKSVEIIDAIGFERFTFKKLASQVNSTEPSIYRYFENKHRLLHYLTAWYWNWLDYRLGVATSTLHAADENLRAAIRVITEEEKIDPSFGYIDESALRRIMINELEKTFLTKWVDEDNQAGFFEGFNALTGKVAGYIKEVAPHFEFPDALASTILLASNRQVFFIRHLSSLSNIEKRISIPEQHAQLRKFIESIVFGTLKK